MRNRQMRFITRVLMILILAYPVAKVSAAGQDNQDQETRIHQKMEHLQTLVHEKQQEGADMRPVADLMKGFQPLIEGQKFTEAEALLDHAIDLASKSESSTQTGPPLSLQRKVHCLQAQVQKWQEEGKDPQPIGEIMQDFDPLAQQQKFAEAEVVVDRALKVAGGTCPDQPANASDAPPASLQEKAHRLQALFDQRQQEGADLQPVEEVMQGFDPLMQQKKYSEAEALVDQALKLLQSKPAEKTAGGDNQK